MPLDSTPLWSSPHWSGCVLAGSSLLLPALLLFCACCAKRKSGAPPDDQELGSCTELPSLPAAVEQESANRSPEPQPQPTESQQIQTVTQGSDRQFEGSVVRQLPLVPPQGKERVRRHSSYTGSTRGSSVYDVVEELRREWPNLDSGASRASRRHTEEPHSGGASVGGASFPIYAQIHKATPTTDTDYQLYAKVKKTGIRVVKSELIL
ncbi:hypothetical protein AGOR_G00120950 [Albula goreensis]|uniref:Uncharacterized protein n=1 Tax=Albula goreensis TaxID=1534307 RepID=A0A8T3DF61_9TELE|nr:hypothetical protein AGOR_G00120950 [Albula goreensis]